MIVVPVLITSCHVSLKRKDGPNAAHATMIAQAARNVTGRPETCAVRFVSRVNHDVGLVGLMGADAIIRPIPSMFRQVRRGLWPPVDPSLVDAGREGELAIARTRIAVVSVLAVNPAAALLLRNPLNARGPDSCAVTTVRGAKVRPMVRGPNVL
jgi:hypothetical protein